MREPIIHEVKTWPGEFEAILRRDKIFEFRKDDRQPSYEVGDVLRLREFDPMAVAEDKSFGVYTTREALVRITYVLRNSFGMPPGYCVMSICRIAETLESFKSENQSAETRRLWSVVDAGDVPKRAPAVVPCIWRHG